MLEIEFFVDSLFLSALLIYASILLIYPSMLRPPCFLMKNQIIDLLRIPVHNKSLLYLATFKILFFMICLGVGFFEFTEVGVC